MIAAGYSKRISEVAPREAASIKEQNDKIRSYARENGFKIARFYEDKGNDPDGDAGFQKMREDGMNGAFDILVLDSVFRCGKNYKYARNLLYETFYKTGIRLVILEDGIRTEAMTPDEVEAYFDDARARYRIKLIRSREAAAFEERHVLPTCREIYGYLLSDDRTRITVDQEAAEVIRYVFRRMYEGARKCDVAAELNERGIETPSVHLSRVGAVRHKEFEKWDSCIVKRLLKKEAYLGEDPAAVENGTGYPQIIDGEMFRKVGETFHHEQGRMKGQKFLFRQRVFDGRSGKPLVYRERETEGGVKGYYFLKDGNVPLAEFDAVEACVRKAIEAERQRAAEVLAVDGERKRDAMKAIDEKFHERAGKLFQECLRAQEGNVELYKRFENGETSREEYDERRSAIRKRQEAANAAFQELMDQCAKRKEGLGKENPWVKRIVRHDPRKKLTPKAAAEMVKRIEVSMENGVRVILNEEGKELIPVEWLMEKKDGEKKQKKHESGK